LLTIRQFVGDEIPGKLKDFWNALLWFPSGESKGIYVIPQASMAFKDVGATLCQACILTVIKR
jgi:hypothetical protein